MGSIQATYRVEGDALARLEQIRSMLKRPEAMWKEVARRAANECRRHFVARDGEPNKLAPGRREHFWAQVREAVGTPQLDGEGASFTINDARFGLKVYGGTVVPREARSLAIPIHALGYARRPAVFEEETGAKLFRPKGKRVLLADLGQNGKPVAIYILAKSAQIPADPRALPPEAEMNAAVLDQAEKHLLRALANGGVIGQIGA